MTLVLDTTPASSVAPVPPAAHLPTLAGLGREGLAAAVRAAGVPDRQVKMRVNQLWGWIYVRGVTDFDHMTDIGKELRATLSVRHNLSRPDIVEEQISIDGTRKWLLRLNKRGNELRAPEVECVYIPESGRLYPQLFVLPHWHAEAGAQP
jgi:23S rRNA (adenine2503-C2)-methyltransferase